MSRSFDILTESPASVEQIHAAFGREDYWLARIAVGDATITTTLDSLLVDADGTVTVRVTQHLGRQLLPGLVAKFVPGDLKILNCETWRPVGDRQVRGQVNVSVSGGLGSCHAEAWLAASLRRSDSPPRGSPNMHDIGPVSATPALRAKLPAVWLPFVSHGQLPYPGSIKDRPKYLLSAAAENCPSCGRWVLR